MKSRDEVLEMLDGAVEHSVVEAYISRQWVRPSQVAQTWHFEDIDIARLQLVFHLTQNIHVNEEGVDVALSLLDQLYGLRAQMRQLTHAITRQPPEVREDILALLYKVQDGRADRGEK